MCCINAMDALTNDVMFVHSLFNAIKFIAYKSVSPLVCCCSVFCFQTSMSTAGPHIVWYMVIFALLLTLYSHTLSISFGSQFAAFTEIGTAFYYLIGALLGE